MESNALSTANAGALADIEAANAGGADPATTAAPAAPAAPTPQVDGQPAAAAPVVQPLSTQPTELELKWNGQTIKTPIEQAIKLAQQGFDYTQKSQAIAEERRQIQALQAQISQYRERTQQMLNDPALVKQHYESLLQATGQAVDPNEVPTVAQMQAALKAEASRIQADTQREIQKAVESARTNMEVSRLTSDYTQAAESTITALQEAHPILGTVDDIDVLLRQDAWKILSTQAQADPEYAPSKDDVQKALKQAATARAAKMEAKVKEHEKMAVARHAKLVNQGIEPPGGKAVTPTPTQKHKLGSKDLTAAAIADIEAMMKASTQ